VLNRGNARSEVFHDADDYAAFVELMVAACERVAMRIVSWCLMPNHFHLVVWPRADGDLARWMQWLMTSHVRRYHRRYGTSGHVWQGRFKSFPIQRRRPGAPERASGVIETADPVWTAVRYVERNPLRANLVRRAENWRWSSLHVLGSRPGAAKLAVVLTEPTPRPRGWVKLVNQAQSEEELAAMRRSVTRGTPLGGEAWVRRIAAQLGLESTLRPRGRPRKDAKK
jgi:putative transposase